MKLAIGVEYLGGQYSGWQFQGHEPNTIQNHVQQALSFVANEPVLVHASGRTDAGVNALAQICHFETNVERSLFSWRQGANTRLPKDIRIQWVQEVDDHFHGRLKALYRDYIYVIHQSQVPSAVWGQQVTTWRKSLDVQAMRDGAQCLIGEHDFSTFRAAGCQSKSPVRRILEASLWQQGDFLAFAIRGNAFLQHMVRNIVGSLLMVGEGAQKPCWISGLITGKDRSQAGPTALAQGLYFRTTHYAPHFGIQDHGTTPFGLFDSNLRYWPAAYPDVDFGDRI